MPRRIPFAVLFAAIACCLVILQMGCRSRQNTPFPTPAASGLNSRDLVDPVADADSQELSGIGGQFNQNYQKVQTRIREILLEDAPKNRPPRNVLCLSGGGSYGAFTAGVLLGWSQRGDRPCFDVVTGISTGALIAPLAFLGPQYDTQLQKFYTTSTNRDIFKRQYVRGILGGEAFSDTTPLRRQIEEIMSPQTLAEIAEAHRSGRRLIIGTTEQESRRFVLWDIGEIASRNGPGDRELIIDVLIGSASIPGVFPPSKITISVDGKRYTERHVDGGTSQALFFYPPYVPPEQRTPQTINLAGTNVYAVIAGKLYADPEVMKTNALSQATKSVSTLIYAQSRGDLQRLWTYCLLNGMNFNMSSLPAAYADAGSSGDFEPEVLQGMFEEGRRVICSGQAWRNTPPVTSPEQGELPQTRWGRCLTYQPRGPQVPIMGPRGKKIPPRHPDGHHAAPPAIPYSP